MNRKSSHTSDFASIYEQSRFDDEEITADYNINDLGELPPTPALAFSDFDDDFLRSITNLNQQDIFRSLHQKRINPDASQAIATAANHKDVDSYHIAPLASGTLIKPQDSDSLHIEIAASETSAQVDAMPTSGLSLGSRQSLPADPIEAEDSLQRVDQESAYAAKGVQTEARQESIQESVQESVPSVLWKCRDPLLELRGITLLHSEKVLLHDVNLDIGSRGIYVIVCAEAFYRKLLLTLLSGTNRGANVRLEGHARFGGETLGTKYYPQFCAVSASELLMTLRVFMCRNLGEGVAAQIPSLFAEMGIAHLVDQLDSGLPELETHERRAVALLRAFLGSSPLLCIDDPLDGLKDGTGSALLSVICKVAQSRAVLVMAPELGPFGSFVQGVAFFNDGQFVAQPLETESEPPPQPALKSRAGSSATNHPALVVAAAHQPSFKKSARTPASSTHADVHSRGGARPVAGGQQGPRGFRWLVEGSLAGTPEPGILFDIDYDLTLLRSAGITTLVTLTERPLPESLLEAHGLKSLFFPIVDMNVPSCRATEDLCALVELALARGEVIAFHCKAGLGRTGTLLVSYLIWEGAPPSEALEVARSIEPGWVQSSIQEQYLFEFAAYCSHKRSVRDVVLTECPSACEHPDRNRTSRNKKGPGFLQSLVWESPLSVYRARQRERLLGGLVRSLFSLVGDLVGLLLDLVGLLFGLFSLLFGLVGGLLYLLSGLLCLLVASLFRLVRSLVCLVANLVCFVRSLVRLVSGLVRSLFDLLGLLFNLLSSLLTLVGERGSDVSEDKSGSGGNHDLLVHGVLLGSVTGWESIRGSYQEPAT